MAEAISFDKSAYNQGEQMVISYEGVPGALRSLRLEDPNGTELFKIRSVIGKGTQVYTLRADAPVGMYKAELTTVMAVVKASASAEVTGVGAPPADKGYLTLTTSPTGASVTVDGASCGTTPVTSCELSVGAKTVTISKTGYTTETRNITITAGQTSNLGTITLTPTGAPPDEGITKELDIGEYEATWTLSGYDTLKARIEVKDTGVTCISVTAGACNSATPPGVTISTFTVTGHLKSAVGPPTKGYLTVNTSPTGALVMVNGVSCGITPVTGCVLSTGSKTVTITKSGYNTITRSVTIAGGQTSDLGTITLTPTGAPPAEMTTSEFLTEIQNRGVIDLSKIPAAWVQGKWWKASHITRYREGPLFISMEHLDTRNPPSLKGDVYFYINYASVESISRDLGITAINALPFVGVAPPAKFDDWVDSKGGKDAIKGKDIGELVDAFTGIGDVGFSVTGGNINKATDYYTGIG